MNDKLILFGEGMSDDKLVIKTDAPMNVLHQWAVELNKMMEDGIGGYPQIEGYRFEVVYNNQVDFKGLDEDDYLDSLSIDYSYDLNDFINDDREIEILKEDRIGAKYFFLGERNKSNIKTYVSGTIDKTYQELGVIKYDVNNESTNFEEINSHFYEQLSNEALKLNNEMNARPKEAFDSKKVLSIYMFNSLLNKVVVLDEKVLNPDFKRPTEQLYLAVGGFGCRPEGSGNAVFAINLYSKKEVRLEKYNLNGVLLNEDLPDWAKQSLMDIQKDKKEKGRER